MERRSEELRKLLSVLCTRDLQSWSRIRAGLEVTPASMLHQAGTQTTEADVDVALADLWRASGREAPAK
jgi:hypothetical protein